MIDLPVNKLENKATVMTLGFPPLDILQIFGDT